MDDDLQVAPGLEHGAVDRVGHDRQQPLLARYARHELVVRKVALPVDVDVAGGFELREHGGRDSSGDEDGRFRQRLVSNTGFSPPSSQCP